MKTIIREMVETIKQLFAQKQQMQEPVVANYEVSEIVEQKTLRKSLRRQVKKRVNLINGVNR